MSEQKKKLNSNSVDILKMRSNVGGEDSPESAPGVKTQTEGSDGQGRKIQVNSAQVLSQSDK